MKKHAMFAAAAVRIETLEAMIHQLGENAAKAAAEYAAELAKVRAERRRLHGGGAK